MLLKKQDKYTLSDIEKLFTKTPIFFIIFLSIIALLVSFFIIDFKKNKEIGLLKQKELISYEYTQKNKLDIFLNDVDKLTNRKILTEESNLKKATFEVIGFIKSHYLKIDNLSEIENFLKNIEQKYSLKFAMFSVEDEKILYGEDLINYVQNLIFDNSINSFKQQLTLKYIYSQGENNLQYWKDEINKNIKLSYFDSLEINSRKYHLGFFSTLKSLKKITLESLYELVELNQNDFWFFDFSNHSVYNFYGKKDLFSCEDILQNYKNYKKYLVLRNYCLNDINDTFRDEFSYFYRKFDLIVNVNYDEQNLEPKISKEIEKIKSDYTNWLLQIFVYILVITTVLILITFSFISFLKEVFTRYNNNLKEKTQTLEHWKKRFELAIIASNDGLWDIDFKKNKIFFSKKWLEMFEYEKDEIKTLDDWFNLIHNEDKQNVKKLFSKIFDFTQDTIICEYRLLTKNSGFKWVFARGRAFKDEDGKLDRMLMMSMDIDKNKKMKKELLDVELLVEDGRIVLFKLNNDEQLSVNFISNSIKKFGYVKNDFEDKKLNFLDFIFIEDKKFVKDFINSVVQKDLKDFSFECRVQNAKNETRWISCRAIVIKNHSGEIIYFYGYFNDINKIKLYQEELKNKVQMELDKNRQKDRILIQQSKLASMGEMLGAIAHQWRQPLNNVNLIIHFLYDYYNSEKVDKTKIEKYINNAKKNIEYLSQTIDDFRNFYKPSKEKNSFKLKDCINLVFHIIEHELKEFQIKFEVNGSNYEIYSFENEFKQALLNILNNAKDAIVNKRKKGFFEAYIIIDVSKNDGFIEINIKNNGGNIPNDIIDRIFEPYFTTKFEDKGTGIGLYMTKSIIENNIKGSIKVENLNDDEVVFKILLNEER